MNVEYSIYKENNKPVVSAYYKTDWKIGNRNQKKFNFEEEVNRAKMH